MGYYMYMYLGLACQTLVLTLPGHCIAAPTLLATSGLQAINSALHGDWLLLCSCTFSLLRYNQ